MSKNVEFIPRHVYSDCWTCDGKGKVNAKIKCLGESIMVKTKCRTCKGSGKHREDQYHLIYKDKNGQKMSFNVDTLK